MSVEDRSDGRTVQLKRVRLSFTDSLYEKKKPQNTQDDARPAHSCNVIIESDSPNFEANKKKVLAALAAAGERAWKNADAWKTIAEDNPKRVCFRRGERFKNQESGEVYEGYAGNWGISGKGPRAGQQRPKMLDRHKREVQPEDIMDVMYSGTYADVIVSFYGTDKGNRGIFCSIEAIRSHQEGERLGGGAVHVDADDFDDLDDDDSFGGTNPDSEGGSDLDLLG